MAGIVGSLILTAIIGYVWGSLPAGYWLGKIMRGKNFDIRDYGSHKIGATNVLRTLGPVAAAIAFLFDISKGIGPTLLATLIPALHGAGWGPGIAGITALLGHCFPVFIGFKGGRGVMTAGGALLIISWPAFVITAVFTIGTIAIWRYVSLGSITGAATAIVCGIIFFIVGLFDPTFFAKVSLAQLVFLVIAPGLVIIFHHDNIGRLLSGTERKLGQKETIPSSKQAPSNAKA